MERFNDSPDDQKTLDSTHEMNQKKGSLVHGFNAEFDKTVNKIFPAEFVMIGGSADYQISLDVSQLPGNLGNGGYDSQRVSPNLSKLRNEHFS